MHESRPPSHGQPPKIAGVPVQQVKSHDPNLDPISLVDEAPRPRTAAPAPVSKIRFGPEATTVAHNYKRQPKVTGQGAIRVRTFHGRLSDEGMSFMDDKINEWLDGHEEIEIKFVTTSIGTYEGKIREPALVVNVWY